MNFEELEKLVIKKAPLPMSGRYEETVCFLALRGLYTSLAGKRITKEQAVKERVQLKKEFYHMCWLHDRYAAALAQYQEFLRLAGRYGDIRRAATARGAGRSDAADGGLHCFALPGQGVCAAGNKVIGKRV